jgi:hypothetical protein
MHVAAHDEGHVVPPRVYAQPAAEPKPRTVSEFIERFKKKKGKKRK